MAATISRRSSGPLLMSKIIEALERAQLREGIPKFKAGDTVRVHFQVIEGERRRVHVFEGVAIKRQGAGARDTFTARKQSFGVRVERTFPLHSPKIEKLELRARALGTAGSRVIDGGDGSSHQLRTGLAGGGFVGPDGSPDGEKRLFWHGGGCAQGLVLIIADGRGRLTLTMARYQTHQRGTLHD